MKAAVGEVVVKAGIARARCGAERRAGAEPQPVSECAILRTRIREGMAPVSTAWPGG
mgnify:CR=1 FL=1